MPQRDSKDARKELKVMLPLEFHVKLHALKLITGQTMSAAVEEALATYLAERAGLLHVPKPVPRLRRGADIRGVPELL